MSAGCGDIALFHNYPHPLGPGGAVSGFTTPFNLMGLEEKLDFVGFDIYSRKELYEHVKTVVSYVVGTSRYPVHPRVHRRRVAVVPESGRPLRRGVRHQGRR